MAEAVYPTPPPMAEEALEEPEAPVIQESEIEPEGLGVDSMDEGELLQVLLDYFHSAEEARKSGVSGRDREWELNWEAYWSRYDTSMKEEWQADERLPDMQDSVDRGAAHMREVLLQTNQWYDITIPGDKEGMLVEHIRRFMGIQLERCGTDATTGHILSFDHPFYETAKAGFLMAMAGQVRVDSDGRTVFEPLDAREIFYDPTRRGRFRIRRYPIDWDELRTLADEDDSPWDVEAIERLKNQSGVDEEGRVEKEQSSGTAQTDATVRTEVTLLEYRCDIINQDGELVAKNQQVVVADEREIVLGPRPNPFWHKKDWIVYTPLITVPFSVYGRSVAEGFRKILDTYIGMTNLIVDGAFISTIKAFQIWTDALEDPAQADSIHPMKIFHASDEVPYGVDFVKAVDLGGISPSSFSVWQILGQMVKSASNQNELTLGQFPSGERSAREVTAVDQGQSQMARSMARDVDARFISVILDLMWATSLQFFDERDEQLKIDLGEACFEMLRAQRKAFVDRKVRFKAKGISEAIARNERVRSSMMLLQVVMQSPELLQLATMKISLSKWLDQLFRDMGVDTTQIALSPQEKLEQDAARKRALEVAQAQGQGGSQPTPGGGPGGAPGVRQEG